MHVNILLFNDFETLDVFGPVEIFGRLADYYTIHFYSLQGGIIHNNHGVEIVTQKLTDASNLNGIFLIPGGLGTRQEVNNVALMAAIKETALRCQFVLTVCTGSALLAKTGLLDHKSATTNKRAFLWVTNQGPFVQWNKNARWVVDGIYYTSSGVSAGIDMTLGFISNQLGIDVARRIAYEIEYNWIEDCDNDNFKVEEEI
jgi:transcriptional regulator GlxA family with amidase domain